MEKEPFESLEKGLDKDLSSLLKTATHPRSSAALLTPLAQVFGMTGLSLNVGRSAVAVSEASAFQSLSDRFAQQIAVFPLTNHVVINEFGAFIPREMLRNQTNIDHKDEKQSLVIRIQIESSHDQIENSTRLKSYRTIPKDDPIYDIGKNPVKCGVPDASENLDKYLYGG